MSRSRNGCANCKRRHRKCDETRPSCLACEAQGLECAGYDRVLRWDVGTAAARRHQTHFPTPVYPRPTAGITIATADALSPLPEQSSQLNQPRETTHSPGPSSPTSWPEPPPLTDQQQQQESSLVDEFFRENVYQLYSTSRDDDFPRQLHKMSKESSALAAIIAGMHLYLENPSDETLSFEPHRTRGLALFRSQLETYNGSLDASVLSAGVFICTMSLYQGTPWTFLLEHMMNVYELQRHFLDHMPQLRQPSMLFFVEAIGIMDMPTFVRGRKTSTHGIWAQMRSAQRAQQGDYDVPGGIETLTGLPRSLLDIFADIQDETAESRFLSWPGEVGEVPETHLWEAYRCAGALTARRTRRQARPHQDSYSPSAPDPPVLPTGTEAGTLQHPNVSADMVDPSILMSRLIAALDALCATRSRPEYSALLTTNALLYPLAAARLEVPLLRRHPSWLQTLDHVYQTCQPYGGTANARHVMEMLDEALDADDDGYDMDERARGRQVEVALF